MWKRSLAVLPGIGVSLLPKLVCPMCWPAYAGLLSALGLGFLISTKYLLALTVAFLSIAAAALGFRASRRYGYGPFWLGLVAAAVILTGKFYFDVGVGC
jgi:mercuric ion transport protein